MKLLVAVKTLIVLVHLFISVSIYNVMSVDLCFSEEGRQYKVQYPRGFGYHEGYMNSIKHVSLEEVSKDSI